MAYFAPNQTTSRILLLKPALALYCVLLIFVPPPLARQA
jgi:hypothetical protein